MQYKYVRKKNACNFCVTLHAAISLMRSKLIYNLVIYTIVSFGTYLETCWLLSNSNKHSAFRRR